MEQMHSLVRGSEIAELKDYKKHLAGIDQNQENLFHSAAFSGNEETCTYLFDNGKISVDQRNK